MFKFLPVNFKWALSSVQQSYYISLVSISLTLLQLSFCKIPTPTPKLHARLTLNRVYQRTTLYFHFKIHKHICVSVYILCLHSCCKGVKYLFLLSSGIGIFPSLLKCKFYKCKHLVIFIELKWIIPIIVYKHVVPFSQPKTNKKASLKSMSPSSCCLVFLHILWLPFSPQPTLNSFPPKWFLTK